MAILIVGGTQKGAGKTTLICALIDALPDFPWTALKITTHNHGPHEIIQEETKPGAPSIQHLSAGRVGINEPPSSHATEISFHEETEPGRGTDTARYLAAGAHRAFLISAPEAQFSLAPLLEKLEPCPNLILESNRVPDGVEPELTLAILAGSPADAKPSFASLLQRADAIIVPPGTDLARFQMPPRALLFGLRSLLHIPPEMQTWLQARLTAAHDVSHPPRGLQSE